MIRPAVIAAIAFALMVCSAQAHPRRQPICVPNLFQSCSSNNFLQGVKSIRVRMKRIRHVQLLSHPHGCPPRAFCGCGAAVHLFGHPVRSLFLAANWFRFPRAAPSPGMAAVRRHHVFVLERHLNGKLWLAYDANSGHHTTQIHARSINGYVIVNPRAG